MDAGQVLERLRLSRRDVVLIRLGEPMDTHHPRADFVQDDDAVPAALALSQLEVPLVPRLARTDQECNAVRVGSGPGLTDTHPTLCAIIVSSLPLRRAWPRVVKILTLPSRLATYNDSSP